MEVGFSVMKKDNIWLLKVQNSCTQGSFGTLAAAMRCAYTLANGIDGQATCTSAAIRSCEEQLGV